VIRYAALASASLAFSQTPVAQEPVAMNPAPVPNPATTPAKGLQATGYLDFYFQTDFGQPRGRQPANGRGFDTTQGAFKLSAAQLDLSLAPTVKHPFGFWLTGLVGPEATLFAATEPAGIDKYKDLAQAYVTYLAPTRFPLTFDFGKWYSFVGYEGIDNRVQDNYSRSLLFAGLEPGYMTGLRGCAVVSGKLTLNGYLYQGFNEVQNSNSTLMSGLGATMALTPALTATLQGYYGKESSAAINQSGTFGGIGFPTPGESWVTQGNLVVTYQPNPKDKFAVDATQASATRKGDWSGIAAYYRRQIDGRNAVGIRVERAADPDGIRFLAGPLLLHSLTATYDYTVNKNLNLRFELRHDLGDNPFFNADSGLATHRTTFTFAQIVKF